MPNSFWEKLTPAQRSEEMSKRRAKAKTYNHPGGAFRDPEFARIAGIKGGKAKPHEVNNSRPDAQPQES